MRKFILNVVVTLFFSASLLASITILNARRLQHVDCRLDSTVHIIAIGPSTTGCALNEEHIGGFRNISRGGLGLTTLELLPYILNTNPQIDTVLINYGRYYFLPRKNDATKQIGLQEIRDRLPFLLCDTHCSWDEYLLNINFYGAMLNPDWHDILFGKNKLKDYGFCFTGIERQNLFKDDSYLSIKWYDEHCIDYTEEWFSSALAETNTRIVSAINTCHEYGVVPVLFFTPLYHYDRWCKWGNAYKCIADINTHTLIADYEDFVFPDERYYGDVHHLNKIGADYFTSHIAKEGLECLPLSDWMLQKQLGYNENDTIRK